MSGQITTRNFQDGTDVKKGDILFTIDARPYQAVLEQAQGQLSQAKSQLVLDQITLKRQQDLRSKGVNSPQDYDTAQGTVNNDEAKVKSAEGAVVAAQWNVDNCDVRSPIDGRNMSFAPWASIRSRPGSAAARQAPRHSARFPCCSSRRCRRLGISTRRDGVRRPVVTAPNVLPPVEFAPPGIRSEGPTPVSSASVDARRCYVCKRNGGTSFGLRRRIVLTRRRLPQRDWISHGFMSFAAMTRKMRYGPMSKRCARRNAARHSRGSPHMTNACCGGCR